MDRGTGTTPSARESVNVSDEFLRERQFTTDDPEGLNGLSLDVPQATGTPIIEFAYDLTPPRGEERDYVRCAHCRYRNHWRGYVMLCQDGTRFLVGKDCGARVYGADFGRVERSFGQQRTRQGYLRRLENMAIVLPDFLSAVEEITEDQVFFMFERCRKELSDRLPILCQHLNQAIVGRGGALVLEQRVRDYAAELRRADQQQEDDETENLTTTQRKKLRKAGLRPHGNSSPIYRSIDQTVGRVAGAALLRPPSSPKRAFEELSVQLDQVASSLLSKPTDEISAEEFRDAFLRLADILDGVEEQLETLEGLSHFFAPQNLRTVCDWANQLSAGGGSYRTQGQKLLLHTGDDEVSVAPPVGYHVPRPKAVGLTREALSFS